jgi:cytochrome P450
MHDYIAARPQTPKDDLITHLIAAGDAGDRLTTQDNDFNL